MKVSGNSLSFSCAALDELKTCWQGRVWLVAKTKLFGPGSLKLCPEMAVSSTILYLGYTQTAEGVISTL